MDGARVFASCTAELRKLAGESNVARMLSNLAVRKGFSPEKLPSIKQVQNVAAAGDRGRAAQIAANVRRHLKLAK